MNRRDFVRRASLMGTSLPLQMGLMQKLAADANTNPNADYKAVICLLLAGGIDSFRILVPNLDETTNSEWKKYSEKRGIATISKDKLIELTTYSTSAKTGYSLNPLFENILKVPDKSTDEQNSGVAFIANVGALKKPFATVQNFLMAPQDDVPFALLSHNDQIKQAQTLDHTGLSPEGWMKRLNHWHLNPPTVLNTPPITPEAFASVSLAGENFAQSGPSISPLSIEANGPASLQPAAPATSASMRVNAHKNALFKGGSPILGCEDYQRNVLQKLYADITFQSFNNSEKFRVAYNCANILLTKNLPTILPSNTHSTIASLIKAMQAGRALGLTRQVFFLTVTNWDHHTALAQAFDKNVKETLAPMLSTFREATQAAGFWDKVCLFTISDFGRTLVPNSSGTDHGWGGNHIVMGGSVRKGVYGKYPKMQTRQTTGTAEAGKDVNDEGMRDMDSNGYGIFVPTTSWDEYLAPIAKWFGVNLPTALEAVLPNLKNFTTPRTDLSFIPPHV
jgi:uncharacterized protein (DUF1501 family)